MMNMIIPEKLEILFKEKLVKNKIGYMLLKLNKLKNELELEKEGEIDTKVNDISKLLPSNECRIILFNFSFKQKIEEIKEESDVVKNEEEIEKEDFKKELEEKIIKEVIMFFWIPHDTDIKEKFLYSSSKSKILSVFEFIKFEYLIDNKNEFTDKNILERILLKTS